MTIRASDFAAPEKALFEPCSSEGATFQGIYALSTALQSRSANTQPDAAMLAATQVLSLTLGRTWQGALDPKPAYSKPFQPMWSGTDENGMVMTAFRLEDLTDISEAPLRQMATDSQNVAVQSRIRHVLWERFRKQEDARAAIDSYIAQIRLLDPTDGWVDIVMLLGHAIGLALELRANDQLEVLVALADEMAIKILGGGRPFAFSHLADLLGGLILPKASVRSLLGDDRIERWLLALALTPAVVDPLSPDKSLRVLEGWLKSLKRPNDLVPVRRQMVEALLTPLGQGLWNIHRFESAVRLATNFGLQDLKNTAQTALMRAIEETDGQMAETRFTAELPAQFIRLVDDILGRCTEGASAIRELANSGILQMPVAAVEQAAKESMKTSVFAQIASGVQMRDQKIAFRSINEETHLRAREGEIAATHVVTVEATLSYFLRQGRELLEEATLIDAVSDWPYLRPSRHTLLARSSERFAAGDWISAGMIVIPIYEALLRDLLRSAGYAAMKGTVDGPQLDETLGSLLRQAKVVKALGANHVWFVEHLLCRPEMGPNMRNEVAHGTVDPSQFTPTKVLLIWLFVVRLMSLHLKRPVEEPNPAALG